MKDTDQILSYIFDGDYFIPANQEAIKNSQELMPGQYIYHKDVSTRDAIFHAGYFKFLSFCYSKMPVTFKKQCPNSKFYLFLKIYTGKYQVSNINVFGQNYPIVEYDSISFKNMTEEKFERFVKDQIPDIYKLINESYDEYSYEKIIQEIELEYVRFLSKLYEKLK
jgi:hypothetical protein